MFKMPKKTKTKDMKKKKLRKDNVNDRFWIMLIAVLILLLIIIILFLRLDALTKQFQMKLEDNEKALPDREWLIENCQCVEWNGPFKCPEGFELIGEICKKNKTYTNPLVLCSKYKCPEYYVNITK